MLTLQSLASRVVLFGTQIVLGWLLSAQDFGLAATATAVGAFAWTIVGLGMDEVLQQRGSRMQALQKTVLVVCLAEGLLAFAVLAAAAPFIGGAFDSFEVTKLVWITSLSLPLAALLVIPTARLQAAFDFKWITGLNTALLVLGQGLTVLLAWAGFGAYSMFIPAPAVLVARALFSWRRAKPKVDGPFRPRLVLPLLSRGSMALATRIISTFIAQGSYLVLGLMATSSAVGLYFFAFRFAAMPIQVIAESLHSVLFPALTTMRNDPARQRDATLHVAALLSYLITPFCWLQIVAAAPAMHIVFDNKWDDSILLLQILCIGLPAEAISTVARAGLNAQGAFKRALILAAVSASIYFSFVVVGAWLGSALGMATGVCAYYTLVQPIFFFLAMRPPTVMRHVLQIYLKPLLISVLTAAAAAALGQLAAHLGNIVHVAVILAVFAALYPVLLRFANASILDEYVRMARSMWRGKPSATPA